MLLDPQAPNRYHGAMNGVRVAELFAGVGGFRIGFERANRRLGSNVFQVVWSNQWEPSTKAQHASDVYVKRFGAEGHLNVDIAKVPADDIPDIEMLVGGFPCQDYSVATTLQRSGGLAGKKGVLWWEIHRLLRDKAPRPKYLFLENVDRLLKSPASQRGRDFAVMLASLSDLGYAVEWRVVNAAEYGMPQRRRRVFILGYLQGTKLHDAAASRGSGLSWLHEHGVFAKTFPVVANDMLLPPTFPIEGDLVEVSHRFNGDGKVDRPFANAGLMVNREVLTARLDPHYVGAHTTLGELLVAEELVPPEFFIGDELPEWEYLKGAKVIDRVNKSNGHKYRYSEGAVAFPDPLDRPSRTVITGEGGRGPSRFKHVVLTPSGRYRRLVPVELERLNMFPDGHTAGLTDNQRAFLMGNALVTGVIDEVSRELAARIVKKESRVQTVSRKAEAVLSGA